MKANIGGTDKIVRIIAGIILIIFFFVLDGGIRYVGLLGIVFLVTAFINFCPLYTVFGMNTRKKKG